MADDRSEMEMTFRKQLIGAGHLIPLGAPGVQGWGPVVDDLRDGIAAGVRRIGAELGARRMSFYGLLPTPQFVDTGYLGSFPQLIGSLAVFTGGDKEHRALTVAADLGKDWTGHLEPAGLMMVTAACHPVYAALRGSIVDSQHVEIRGGCFRHEPSTDPFRSVSFTQHEVVALGSPEHALRHREESVAVVHRLLTSWGLDVEVEAANDPFFGRTGRLLAAGQRDGGLKVEFTVAAYGARSTRTAIASVNLHEDHFGQAFDLRLPDGSPAHSACFGLGLERIALALLQRHGLDVREWDAGVRGTLGLT